MTGDVQRDQLAAELESLLVRHGVWPLAVAERAADALLPVVRKIAADELNDLADSIPCSDSEIEAKQMARARADALDPQ